MTLACERIAGCGSVIEEESELEDDDESFDKMSLSEFLEKYADLTAEQLEEVDISFKRYGIHDFSVLRTFATEDLIHHLQMSEETAKKIQLATMKHTCFLFAELAEIGGIPLMRSEPVGLTETIFANQNAEKLDDQMTTTCILC